MLKRISLVFLIIFLFDYCGKEEKSIQKTTSPLTSKKVEQMKVAENSAGQNIPEISEIKFNYPVNESNDLILNVKAKDPEAQININYRWFVNDTEIPGANLNLLNRDFFKRGDWVYCRVKIIVNGISSREKKSKLVKIGGATPVIEYIPVKEFKVPGVFRYTIKASVPETVENQLEPDFGDEEEPENNMLIFKLISPTGSGIVLEEKTGEITWNITREILDSFGSSVEIKFRVTYLKGGSVNSSIILNLNQSEGDESGIGDELSGQEIE